jgi:hypothetical protein
MGAVQRLSMMLHREATVLSFSDTLMVMSLTFAVALAFIPLVRRPRPAGGSVAAH